MEQQNHGGLSGDVQPENMEGQKHREGFGSSCWRVAQCRGEGNWTKQIRCFVESLWRGFGIRIRCTKDGRPDDWETRQGQYTQINDGVHLAKGSTKQHLGTARRTDEVTIDGRDRSSWRESL